ncbi:S8 family peptidase [Dyadobacter frigoris]|uniref:T9SS type A sorting domain-containing protein n=1 Tax=Dyadobacter frigoris TaxID=2576211 RepID=A0A4U6D5S2_9BACT|nr:S8 family peptidase [Dyadobacter frigoris]TKT91557.1 T9SS type A sorting domain-containing protein [Dyadobacter frigoris]GLU51884.1 serine protease [Dyadobacter frigoris]
MKIKLLLVASCILSFLSNFSQAQTNPRYLILFKDKAGSPYSVSRPTEFLSAKAISRRTNQNIAITQHDFPVNPTYVAAIKQTGASVIYSSRWFNASLVEASASQLAAIKNLAFYKGIEQNHALANLTTPSPGLSRTAKIADTQAVTEDLNYGLMQQQLALIGVDKLHQEGFHGENMLIGVLDAGFNRANELNYMKPVFDENRIIDTHDFITRESNVYDDDSHGINALSTIAAYQPGSMIGAAFKASFALYRTENVFMESPYEEVTWLMGAERADSVGVDVISSSLGYNTFDDEFNSAEYNYTYKSMDGKTTIISRAARFATRKGILVVNSAGNEGNKAWHYITAPADVDSVASIGATTLDRSYAAFSSVGPNAIGQLKPDISAVGSGAVVGNSTGTGSATTSSGTSFSAPQIAGLATILWQAFPKLTAQQIITALKKSGNQASNPDNLLGFGVPNGALAEAIIKNDFILLGTEPDVLNDIILSPNPVQQDLTLTFPVSLIGKKSTLSLISQNGKTIWQNQHVLNSTIPLPTNSLSAGLYLIKVDVLNRTRTLKFVKQ